MHYPNGEPYITATDVKSALDEIEEDRRWARKKIALAMLGYTTSIAAGFALYHLWVLVGISAALWLSVLYIYMQERKR